MPTALLVGCDQEGTSYLKQALGDAYLHCEVVAIERALSAAVVAQPDIVILDAPLVDDDVVALCQHLRSLTNVAVVICSMSRRESDIIRVFEAGADDYLMMPMRPAEMAARLHAVLRRSTATPADSRVICAGGLEIRLDEHRVFLRGESVDLSPIEFRLLVSLAREQGRAVSHVKLLSSVWGPEYVNCGNYLRLYIRYLRSKLEDDPRNPHVIVNEWGVGYRFEPPVALPQ